MILLDFPDPEEACQKICALQYIFVKLDVMRIIYVRRGDCVTDMIKQAPPLLWRVLLGLAGEFVT